MRVLIPLILGVAFAAPAFADPAADVSQGREALAGGDYRAAVGSFGKAIDAGTLAGGALAEAHALRCRALAAAGLVEPAESDAEAALRLDPASAEAQACRAAIAMRNRAFADAVSLYDKAIELGGRDPDLRAGRAVALAMSGRPEDGLAALDKVLAENPKAPSAKRADWLTNRARLRAARGRLDAAIHDIDQALVLLPEQDPERAEAHFLRARLHIDRRQYGKALDDLNWALSLQKDAPPARRAVLYATRGSVYASRDEFPQAIADFTGAIGLAKEAAPALLASLHANRARAKAESGDAAGSLADFEAALRIAPGQPDVLSERAAVHLRQGDVQKAMADLRTAAQAAPNDPVVQSRLAWAHAEQGDYARAIEAATRTVSLRPNDALPYWERGLFRFYQGQFAEAAADFAKVVDQAPSNAFAVLFAHIAAGRAGQAKPDLLARRAARLDLAAWPGPVVRLFLGQAQPAEVLNAAAADAASAAKRLTEANFYVGEWYLLQGQRPSAVEMFNRVVAGGGRDNVEHGAARTELERIGG